MSTPPVLDHVSAARFAKLALDCIEREYPNHPQSLMFDDGDILPPRRHTPAFFGCFDWHSAVHGHWTLVRMLRFHPDATWAESAHCALKRSLTREHLAAEARHLSKPGREGFERPYGLAWLLQLAAELREWNAADAAEFVVALEPLERLCRDRLADWLPKLTHPNRSGEHSQTAFAMGLALDWSRVVGDSMFSALLCDVAFRFYLDDADLPVKFEPSGHDFLSPSLAEADLMRRVLPTEEFAAWLDIALPALVSGGLQARRSADSSDGKLAHLDGLNLSRAWMLDGIASALPDGDERLPQLAELRDAHATAGLASVTGEHYAGGHWLGTFAVYLMTGRGIDA